MGHRFIAVLVAAWVGFGCGKKDSGDSSSKSVADEQACEGLRAKFEAKATERKQRSPGMTAAVAVRRCNEDAWSMELVECLAKAAGDAEECEAKMTREQRKKLADDIQMVQ